MKFNNKEEIKNILEMDITKKEKRNLIANIKNYKTDLARIIAVDEELKIEEGQMWDNFGIATSWADVNAETNNVGFSCEMGGEIEYILKVEKIDGYKVQYFNYYNIFDKLEPELGEDEAHEKADAIANDEVYTELMDLLGSDGDMIDEAEVLVPAETKFEIVEINDGREDTGYIEVILKEIK